jgi:hypothetical protein
VNQPGDVAAAEAGGGVIVERLAAARLVPAERRGETHRMRIVEHVACRIRSVDDRSLRWRLVGEVGDDQGVLELIVLHFDDGRDMVIHAMPMSRTYEILLPRLNLQTTKKPRVVGSSRRTPLPDDNIQHLADEAEAGYDQGDLRPRGGHN